MTLCQSCSNISLEALLQAVPVPRRPRGSGRGVPNWFESTTPKPFSLDLASPETCALCALILAQEASATQITSTAKTRPLQLAALCPPTYHGHHSVYKKDVGHIFDNFGEPQPQWAGFVDGQTRANKMEPITSPEGDYIKSQKYMTLSPWQVHLAAEEGTSAAKYITRRPINPQGSKTSLDALMKLISQCDTEHTGCKLGVNGFELDSPPELPTRVIDVGSATQLPHLVISQGRQDRYITLSHCWAELRWVATTVDTLPMMRDGFSLGSIPKTYADAIIICRKLGVRYLWIDSFSILQDDHEDWQAESAKMGDIYEKAYCNIAATGPSDSSAGFLHTRTTEPTFVRIGDAGSSDSFYFTNQADSEFGEHVRRKRLNTRGWVLQERLLSRRTIHFGTDMWYWECGEHIISEDGWQHETERATTKVSPSLRESLTDTTMAISKVFHSDTANTEKDEHGVATPYTEILWAQILRAYSKCDLTFWTDKLPALQGLASRFSELVEADYHSGHWLEEGETMPLSLMWYASEDGGLSLSDDQKAPSWSCLKANGPVGFHDCRGATPTTRIDNISADGSTITLRGRLKEAKLAMANGENPPGRPTYYSMSFLNKTEYGVFSNTLGPARFDHPDDVPKDFALLLTYEKIPVGKYTNMQKDQLALVLMEVPAKQGGDLSLNNLSLQEKVKTYKRIGIANVNNHNFFANVPFTKLQIA